MYIKTEIKKMIGKVFSTDLLEKLTEYSIWQRHQSLSSTPIKRGGREQLWIDAVAEIGAGDILFLEFGVWQGYSIEYFSKLIESDNSKFYGFDSFEGLPEHWRGMDAGHFSTDGNIPNFGDPRVKFIKGWFQRSVSEQLETIASESVGRSVIVHFDADLYSSTLFLLYTLTSRITQFYFIFDEFSGHESRALYNFIQASGAKVKYLSQTTWQDCPAAVFGYLSLTKE